MSVYHFFFILFNLKLLILYNIFLSDRLIDFMKLYLKLTFLETSLIENVLFLNRTLENLEFFEEL